MNEIRSAGAVTLINGPPGVLTNSSMANDFPNDTKDNGSKDQADNATTTTKARKKSLSFNLSILLLGIIGFLVALDANSLAVALPIIGNELEGSTLETFWAGIAFTLAVAITQPVYSTISDVVGRKIPLYISLSFFTAGSVIFARAENMEIVILGRTVMGFGGGGMDVLQVILLSDVTTLRERPLYMGINAVFNATGAVLGPILGGVFSQYISWRWLGWFNLPFLGISVVLAFFFLRIKDLELEFRKRLERIDWIGILLFGTGGTCLALPLSWANSLFPWSSWRTLLPFIIGLVFLCILAWYERKPAEPVFPYRIFATRTANGAILSGGIHGLLMYSIAQYLPLYYEAVHLHTPFQAGISTLPYCAVSIGFSAISGVVVNKLRRYRLTLWAGWILSTVFTGMLYRLDRNTFAAESYSYQVLMGVGIGTVLTVTALPTQASAKDPNDTGIAAGMLVIFRFFGALIGLTIGSTVFSSAFQLSVNTAAANGQIPNDAKFLQDSTQALSFIPYLRDLDVPREAMDTIIDVYTRAFQVVWLVFMGASVLGFLFSLLIKELSMENDEVGRQGLNE